MYKVIKKNQKRLMAIFAVLLMISFVATIGVGRAGGGGSSRSDPVVAHLGGEAVHDSEMRLARDQWNFLQQPGMSQDFMGRRMSLAATVLPAPIVSDVSQHPELFLLLQKEAERDGVTLTPDLDDVASSVVVNHFHYPLDSDEGRRGVSAIRALLVVQQELQRLGDSIKVSEPAWQHHVAEQQSVRLNLVDLRTDDFEKTVAPPTTQQVQEQFDKYKSATPGQPGQDNPLGFGYQIQTRVKIQYVQVPHAKVVEAVSHHVSPTATGTTQPAGVADALYDWEVQAALYYDSHKDEYRYTPPASEPTLGPATSQPATKPAFKPFEEVKGQIVEKLVEPEADKLALKIASELKSRLQDAYATIQHRDPSATQPTTAPVAELVGPPTSQQSDAPTSFGYLDKIRADVENKYHVAIQIHDLVKDWLDEKQLAQLPGIGTAMNPDGVAFPDYVTSFARPPGLTAIPPAVWESSQTLTDAQQNAYVFRLTAAQPAHAPPSIADVRQQVEKDLSAAQAFQQAKQAGQKLLESAKSVGLNQAARAAGQRVISTALFSPNRVREIPEYPLPDPTETRQLLEAGSELARTATPDDKHPDKLVELPSARRVVVAELGGVQLGEPIERARSRAVQQQRQKWLEQLSEEWFAYPAVVSRLDYKAEEKTGT